MDCRSIAYNRFSKDTVDLKKAPLKAILETIKTGLFPGSQLYLYYKMFHEGTASIDSAEFITDTAFIYKYKMRQEDQTEQLLKKHFHEKAHIDNIYCIIRKSWDFLKDSEASLHPFS